MTEGGKRGKSGRNKEGKKVLCQEVNATCDLCASGTRDGTVSQFEFHTWWARSSRGGVMEHGDGGEGGQCGGAGTPRGCGSCQEEGEGEQTARESGG